MGTNVFVVTMRPHNTLFLIRNVTLSALAIKQKFAVVTGQSISILFQQVIHFYSR